MHPSNKVIQSLWVGKLTDMERLCIKSFLDNGHEFHLYAYEALDSVPEGTTLRNAAEILPASRVKDFQHPQQFADYFRYILLRDQGGWWVDMDTVCLRPFDFDQEYVFARAPSETVVIYNGFVKVPAHSPIMAKCADEVGKMAQYSLDVASFQALGPNLLTNMIYMYDLTKYVLPGDTFDPVHWYNAGKIVDPTTTWDLSKSYSVHLFHAVWNNGPQAHVHAVRMSTDIQYPADCLYERLKRRYMTAPKVSVVMTTFNRPALLRNTLESIKKQTFDSFEVIVVDDGTDGETKGICESFGVDYIKLRTTTVYRNPAQPNNVGLRRAKGDVIILQNAECKHVDPNTIEKLAKAVTDHNAVFAKVTGLKEDGSLDWEYCSAKAPRPFFFCGALKREWITKLRGMDEDYPAGGYDDNDFADRLAKEGVKFVYSDIEVHHQWHSRPTISAEAAAAVYVQKKHAMETGAIGTARNLGREWGSLEPLIVTPTYVPPKYNNPFVYNYAADGCTVDWNDRHHPR